MACTVIGLFDSAGEAADVRRELIAVGLPESDVTMSTSSDKAGSGDASGRRSFWEELKSMFTGDRNSRYAEYYAEGTRRGGTLVTATTPDNLADRAADIMRDHNAIDVDERAAQWRSAGWAGVPDAGTATTGSTAGTAATGEARIPVVEEQVAVGKREVSRGGVRVVRRVTEQPVEADVTLREERVNVERRPVERDLTSADVNQAFQDKVVEVTETAEEPVVAKTARVVEEVAVNKEAQQRTEKVRDTVRKSDVEVERIPGQQAAERTDRSVEESPADQASRTRARTNEP
ncbi:MAG: protein of unknown function DUF2382-containing protein [Phycisphaerales bacterium]|nr:protein of unknown function DUF2382-containing protein [Phycisphaerales bacterium]